MAADTYVRHGCAASDGPASALERTMPNLALWLGASDTTVLADPDGSGGATFLGPFTSLMVEGGS
jgi:hypothetical protein